MQGHIFKPVDGNFLFDPEPHLRVGLESMHLVRVGGHIQGVMSHVRASVHKHRPLDALSHGGQ